MYNTCILIRKIITKDIHCQITFTKRSQIQRKITRQANSLILRSPRTNYGKSNILYEGARMYNKLPTDIKDAKSSTTFKKYLKVYITQNVMV